MSFKKFMLIKNLNKKDVPLVKDFLKGLLGNNCEFFIDEYFIIIHTYSKDDEIRETVESMILDWQQNIQVYLSSSYTDFEKMHGEMKIVSKLFYNYDLKKNFYTEKDLVKELVTEGLTKSLNTIVFKNYANDLQMMKILKVFMENNMNTSQAAEKLFMHRNTLINKLDKFLIQTGYDAKNFNDAFIIYHFL